MTTKAFLLAVFFASPLLLSAQNIGINTAAPDPSAAVEILATNRGLLPPRVALVATNSTTPVTSPATGLLVYNNNTAGAGNTAVSPGYYYWGGTEWLNLLNQNTGLTSTTGLTPTTGWRIGGNSLVSTGNLGSSSNNHIDLVSNGLVRGRISNIGEFFWGTTNTLIAGDLFNVVSNATFPWALNGYSSFNGAGVYGLIQSGTTTFAAVQGEYGSSTSAGTNTSGVRGVNSSPVAGTGFRVLASTGPRMGINGTTTASTGPYTFGIHGAMGSTDIRSGGIFGDDFGFAMGSIGYYAANLTDYSVYGFGNAYQVGIGTGRNTPATPQEPNTQIGLGIYGGVMGGWVRGMVYGTMVKGERFSMYVDGKTYTNAPVTELINTGSTQRTPAYSLVSLTTDIYAKGKAVLQNGEARITLDPAFVKLISENPEDLVITLTPVGASKGIYIATQDASGFTVKENDNNTSAVAFNWIAIGTRRNAAAITHSPEILDSQFDSKMNGVMFNDNNTKDTPQSIWWDGQSIRFDTPPKKQLDPRVADLRHPLQAEKK